MRNRILYSEEERIKVALAYAEANLSAQANVELILRDRFEHQTSLIRFRALGIERDAGGRNGHIDFVDPLPWPAEVGPAWADDVQLGIAVALSIRFGKVICERSIEGGGSSNALGPAKARQHGAFVRRDRKEAHHQRAQ